MRKEVAWFPIYRQGNWASAVSTGQGCRPRSGLYHPASLGTSICTPCPHLLFPLPLLDKLSAGPQKSETWKWQTRKSAGMLWLRLTFIHLLMLELRAGFTKEGARTSFFLPQWELHTSNGQWHGEVWSSRVAMCCHYSLPWSNELHLPPSLCGRNVIQFSLELTTHSDSFLLLWSGNEFCSVFHLGAYYAIA